MNNKEFFSPRVSRGTLLFAYLTSRITQVSWVSKRHPHLRVSSVAGKILSWRLDFEVGGCITSSSPEPETLRAFYCTQFLRLLLQGEPVSGVAACRVSPLEAEYCVPPRWCREEVGPLGGD